MNVLNRMMSYDKTNNENQEQCNCAECLRNSEISKKTEIIGNFEYADDFLIKVKNYQLMRREYEILNTMNLEYWYKDVKTKNFIWKSLHVHGYKYIYHKSIYVKSKEKLPIECKVEGHEPFLQRPNDHLNGHGCSDCSGTKKMTKETFIEKAIKIHGLGRYDYSEVEYVNVMTNVWIICHKHDVPYRFPQTPNCHLDGEGCPLCGGTKKLTLKEFIEKANKKHGVGRYDYSKVKYINSDTDVIIICHNHEEPYEFPQTPHHHLMGDGCPLCCSSKGETSIRNWLIENKIEFEEQKRFKDCKNIKPLPFDFYFPQYNLCIEFDGKQHFIPTDFKSNLTEEEKLKSFESLQMRDNIKTDYCKNNNINLLRIKYTENIKEKLSEYFQNHGIIKELTLFDL